MPVNPRPNRSFQQIAKIIPIAVLVVMAISAAALPAVMAFVAMS